MLKGKANGSYRNKKGTLVFRYTVTGTEKEIEAFKKAQGDFVREDEHGNPIFFSTRYVGENVNLIITQGGKVIADTSEMDKAASISAQYGGNFGEALARAAAEKLLSNAGSSATSSVSAPAKIDQA